MAIFPSFLAAMSILFGISAQMLLLDIHIKDLQNNRCIFFLAGNLLVLAVNTALSLVFPTDQYMKFYVLVVHVPIFIIFWIAARTSAIKIIFALITAVFMIYPANLMLTIVAQTAQWLHPVFFLFTYMAACAVILLVIYRFFKTNFNYLIKYYSETNLLKLSLLPLAYYIVNYWLGMYNFSEDKVAGVFTLRTLFFIITLTAYVLILDIAKSSREKEVLQGVKMALSLRLESAEHQLSALQAAQQQAVVYRHDMRHHLALIGGYLADGEIEKAEKYIRLVQADIEAITPHRYCENDAVNLILSSFAAKAEKNGVALAVDAQLPQALSISETELCALLSNGLENAIEAAARVADVQFRKAMISCQIHKGNLLIFIENSFTGQLTMENGLPQSLREGHGFGVKSMAMIAEKYNGYCSFEAKDEIFTLRIVLPLDK
jgi:hypothetical protein